MVLKLFLFSVILIVINDFGSAYRIGESIPFQRGFQPPIINGEDTTIYDFPYQVSIQQFGSHVCGGSIINENTILGAAHCIQPYMDIFPLYYSARVGSTNRNQGGTVFQFTKTIYHADFRLNNYHSDIALFRIDGFFVYGRAVQPVRIAQTETELPVGKRALLTGWGETASGSAANVLQKVDIPVIAQDVCINIFKSINPITKDMFCAGSLTSDYDSCGGDSGGPLVFEGVQIGIVSWGMTECARYGYPGVYTHIAALYDWIQENIKNL